MVKVESKNETELRKAIEELRAEVRELREIVQMLLNIVVAEDEDEEIDFFERRDFDLTLYNN
ncbi:MAG: hypothetical protein DRN20_04440 [Thermoplasmata archaeon]|nr:MAG: hypothetical protein DRN20_04440 [Thermoplasmata archaeon]